MNGDLWEWPIHSEDKLITYSNEFQPELFDGTLWAYLDLEFQSTRTIRERLLISEFDFLAALADLYPTRKIKITYFQIAIRYPDDGTSITHYRVQYTSKPKES